PKPSLHLPVHSCLIAGPTPRARAGMQMLMALGAVDEQLQQPVRTGRQHVDESHWKSDGRLVPASVVDTHTEANAWQANDASPRRTDPTAVTSRPQRASAPLQPTGAPSRRSDRHGRAEALDDARCARRW